MNEKRLFGTKVKKFEKGYLSGRKKSIIINIVLNFLSAIAVFVMGLILNKMQARNIFSVIALLFVLPIARSFSILLTLFPYKELDEESLNKAEAAVKEKGILLYAPVFTSAERVMHLDLIAVFPDMVIGIEEKPVSDTKRALKHERNIAEAKKYMNAHLKNQNRAENMDVFEDMESFIKAFPKETVSEERIKELKEFAETMKYFVV